ncbi:hypothetical protein SDC9_03898 [bioreactor metagenome]|uniref:HD-GYP domain-containing protein n=1 Tax=bioreactor metagenome TaxID=1076179 RepID=A0A644SUQ4_9ZZZZ|nr:HD domain-containing protein [Negativicutes bacterium]
MGGLTCGLTSFIIDVIYTRLNHGWIVTDENFVVQYVNSAFCQWVEKEANDMLGKSVLDLLYAGVKPTSAENYYYPLIETLNSNKELSGVECYLPAFKRDHWCLSNTYLQRYATTGCPHYVAACYVAIDKYKAVEERLNCMTADVVESLGKAVDARDHYTGMHSDNVAKLMMDFAERLMLSEKEISLAYLSGKVHDIGKIGVPESILNKPVRLMKNEFAAVKRHPDIGADILSGISGFEKIAEAVRYHHERYDGHGYPYGLQGQKIPFMSRLLALCDAYSAMTMRRCYSEPFTPDRALREIAQASGKQFDPEISRVFIRMIEDSQDTWN